MLQDMPTRTSQRKIILNPINVYFNILTELPRSQLSKKHSLFHIELSQFIKLHRILSCALNTEDFIAKNLENSTANK
jgi:hypothetical protein